MLQKKLLIVSMLALLLVPTAPVFAHRGEAEVEDNQTASTTAVNDNHDATDDHGANSGAHKLEAAKLRACKNREKSINNRLNNIATRGQRQMKVFDTIATRVEKFAQDKNAEPSNYSDLVSAVSSQKAAAQSTVDKIKADSVSFKCDGTDPKGALSVFKTDLKSEVSALKEYRTAIKNLIVGVKTGLNNAGGDSHDAAQ